MDRTDLGLPKNWARVEGWLNFKGPIGPRPILDQSSVKIKCPELPVLKCYSKGADASFWKIFPSMHLPTSACTKLCPTELAKLLLQASPFLTPVQYNRGSKVVSYLTEGAPSCQKSPPLPPVCNNNAKSALTHGRAVTDMIGFFVKSGFVAGPFKSPPLKDFRVNSLIAVEQDTKVRPCLNVSLPKGCSFNDNVNDCLVEKINMTSARNFSYAVRECGPGAIMSKFDMCDAYKLMPAKPQDYRLQGFSWLNMYFVELAQIFGAETAVCNFDALGHTLHILSLTKAEIPSHLVFRQLDDLPIVAPHYSNWCEQFSAIYRDSCTKVNVKLAENCPKFDKAFENSTKGKVLGIWFDTVTQTWSYPNDKCKKLLGLVYDLYMAETADKEELESLVGRINDFSLMMPFMRSFKKNAIVLLTKVLTFPHQNISVPPEVRKDLLVWWAVLTDEIGFFPICPRYYEPTIVRKVFTSDAAGIPSQSTKRNRKVGVGLVGLTRTDVL